MNNIEGNNPPNLTNFRNLETVNLNGNRLEGIIPSPFAGFDALQVLDLGNNQIFDTLSEIYFRNFKAMINGEANKMKRRYMERRYGGAVVFAFIIGNWKLLARKPKWFAGIIAMELGLMPSSIAKLTVLESLDLSSNKLEGEIPQRLAGLYSLALLNLSCNQLRE
ncbi:receptor-like protein 7 [Apium graveolens]|uniref:receptor-like protein 7 n=1 Tax=Apium graveolens TaxID=4045 RepID=UPI003D7AECA8